MRTLSTLIGRMSHASQTGIMMAPLHNRGLQRLHLQTVAQQGHGSRVSIPLNYQALADPEVVGLRERTYEWLSSSATPNQCHHLERLVQKGLGCSVPRDIYRRSLECGGSESTHQCLGITSSNLSSKRFTKISATGAQTCPLTFRQYNSGGIYQQAGGYTLPCSDRSGTRTAGSSPGSRCICDSSAYSRDSEWSSRHSLQGARQQNRVDSGQTDLPVNLSEVLRTRSGPICLPPDSSSPQVCLQVPESWGSSRGCLSPGLEQIVLSNPPSCSPSSSYPQEDKRGSGDSSYNCTQLVGTTMVPRANSNTCRSASTSTSVSIPAVPSISTCSAPSSVAVSSSSSLALIRSRYEATGFSKEVVDILLASRGAATQKWHTGPWKAWVCWCSQRGVCSISAPVAEALAFLASLVTQGNLEYRKIALYKSAISQTHDLVGSTAWKSLCRFSVYERCV